MELPTHIQHFSFANRALQLYVPDEAAVKEKYAAEKAAGSDPAFPYWAKLWPSSIALCEYIGTRPGIVKDKRVLELAAGLGLPSMLAATYAREVVCSDHAAEAIPFMRRSALLNRLDNIECRLADWQQYPADLAADVVLLSDINYDPAQFEILNALLHKLLDKGTIIVLSTPQRIMGRSFIAKLLPYCKEKHTGHVETVRNTEEIFIMQLEKRI